MNSYHTDFHAHLEGKLLSWIKKRQKLYANIRVGNFNSVIRVDAKNGVVFDLGCFEGQFLTKYYHGLLLLTNGERLIMELALVIKTVAMEFEETNLLIVICIYLPPRELKKYLKLENGVLYLAI